LCLSCVVWYKIITEAKQYKATKTMSKIEEFLSDKKLSPVEEFPEWMWKREAAQVLNVTEKTLERRANAGIIKQMKKDRKTFYKVSDLITFEKEKDSETIKIFSGEQDSKNNNLQSFNLGMKERMINAQLDKAEADAKKAIYEGNLTFALDHAANLFNLSIKDLTENAKTFEGNDKRVMITRKNLDDYLENL
jgi:hypothetical protein